MLTSYPPAACRASCLCEGGDGADGWEDERKDKKAFRKIKIGVGGTAQGFHRPSGNKHHTFFCSCWICHRNRLWKMSASRQLSESRAIPTKTVLINDTTQLPHDYCTTPGGTLFSTTPGGESMPPPCLLHRYFPLQKMEDGLALCACVRLFNCFMSLWPEGCLVIPIKTKTKLSPAPREL